MEKRYSAISQGQGRSLADCTYYVTPLDSNEVAIDLTDAGRVSLSTSDTKAVRTHVLASKRGSASVRPLYKNSTSRTIRSFERFASGKGGLLTHGDVADPYHSC
jgi:hypothetical protein